ncbi:MAG: polysaccharide deacetylase family protein, partial [Bacteroidia bacterium]
MNLTRSLLMFTSIFICAVVQAASVAITMDDFDIHEQTMLSAEERNKKILAALNKHNAKAALFVIGRFIQANEDRVLLRQWPINGHFIGNHTFDHKPYGSNMSIEM